MNIGPRLRKLYALLKGSTIHAMTLDELKGQRAQVTLRITSDSMGTISVPDSTGGFLTFRAKKDRELAPRMNETIPAGSTVIVTEVDSGEKLCYVSPLPENMRQLKL